MMKGLMSGRKTIKLQLWNLTTPNQDELKTKLSNIAFSRNYAEKLMQSKVDYKAKSLEARILTTDYFCGQQNNHGFKKPLEARISTKGGHN